MVRIKRGIVSFIIQHKSLSHQLENLLYFRFRPFRSLKPSRGHLEMLFMPENSQGEEWEPVLLSSTYIILHCTTSHIINYCITSVLILLLCPASNGISSYILIVSEKRKIKQLFSFSQA